MKKIFKSIFLTLASAATMTVSHAQDGVLDNAFELDGMVTITLTNSTNDVARSMVVQPDGKILLGGHTSQGNVDKFCLIRLNSNGSLDSDFGTNGVAVVTGFPYSSVGYSIALQPDGKIVIAGGAWVASKNNFALARYDTDGELDASFGNAGIVSTPFEYSAFVTTVKLQADGKILVGGTANNSMTDGSAFALARYTSGGVLDDAFGTDGIVTTDVALGSGLGALDRINDLEILSNGKIIAAGFSGANATLVKYNADGSLDAGFGEFGIETYNFSVDGNSFFNDIAIQDPERIIAVGGYTASSGMSDFLVSRYNAATGFLDETFGSAGRLETPLSTEQDVATAVLIQSDGKILVGGSAKATAFQFALTRFDAAGNLDLTFGTSGVTRTSVDADFNQLEAMVLQADGKILAAGYVGDAPGNIGVARYNGSEPLSVNDPLLQFAAIDVYPNPASDEIHISYALHEQLDVVLELRNALGQQVQRFENKNVQADDQQQETLELSGLSSGVYYLSVGTSDALQTFKIVKN